MRNFHLYGLWVVLLSLCANALTQNCDQRMLDSGKNLTECTLFPMKSLEIGINDTSAFAPNVSVSFVEDFALGQLVLGHLIRLDNPKDHFSFLEPLNGCGNSTITAEEVGRARTSVTAAHFQKRFANQTDPLKSGSMDNRTFPCNVATNAGFFNTTSGNCLGNLVSQGRIVRTSPKHNSHFGIRNGSFVVGYVSEQEVLDPSNRFDELITGVGWLVRDGKSFVAESILQYEDMTLQETGSAFATIVSGRTAIGHDAQGRLLLFQVDGQSYVRGVNLYTMAELLISFGAVNAINLDGGGSTTTVVNGSVVNYPSYECKNPESASIRCERPVTSVSCIHVDPAPVPRLPEPEPSRSSFWKKALILVVVGLAVICVAAIVHRLQLVRLMFGPPEPSFMRLNPSPQTGGEEVDLVLEEAEMVTIELQEEEEEEEANI